MKKRIYLCILVVVLKLDEKTDLKQILFLNWRKKLKFTSILTFRSRVRRCHPLRIRIVAFTVVTAFIDCTDIIVRLLLLIIDLWSNLEFIDEVIQCL